MEFLYNGEVGNIELKGNSKCGDFQCGWLDVGGGLWGWEFGFMVEGELVVGGKLYFLGVVSLLKVCYVIQILGCIVQLVRVLC